MPDPQGWALAERATAKAAVFLTGHGPRTGPLADASRRLEDTAYRATRAAHIRRHRPQAGTRWQVNGPTLVLHDEENGGEFLRRHRVLQTRGARSSRTAWRFPIPARREWAFFTEHGRVDWREYDYNRRYPNGRRFPAVDNPELRDRGMR